MVRHLLSALLIFLVPLAARAGESAAIRSPRATATLVAAAAAVAPGEPVELGLRLRLAPGWHTYWQNPGDAGAPPEVTILAPAEAEGARSAGRPRPHPDRPAGQLRL
ncbi:protein-disulfide reductase DsbD domain-containing protein [Dankookia sp. P2]|uniref:protein-disulfide reductase DsbD domain-containing protein n=1 Tax=Dankookia sp. P2 TaxID=3423955 RepID=UPI003D67CAAF